MNKTKGSTKGKKLDSSLTSYSQEIMKKAYAGYITITSHKLRGTKQLTLTYRHSALLILLQRPESHHSTPPRA